MMKDLRASFDVLPFEEYYRAGKASQILNWDKNSRYCPMCGVPTTQVSAIAKRCPECRQEFYRCISPAVIVLYQKRRQYPAGLMHGISERDFQRFGSWFSGPG